MFESKKDVVEYIRETLEKADFKGTRSTVMTRKAKKKEKVYSINSPFDLQDIYENGTTKISDYVIIRDPETFDKDVIIKYIKIEKTKSFNYILPYVIQSLNTHSDKFYFMLMVYSGKPETDEHPYDEFLKGERLKRDYKAYLGGGDLVYLEETLKEAIEARKEDKTVLEVKMANLSDLQISQETTQVEHKEEAEKIVVA